MFDIPELRLRTLIKVITRFTRNPQLKLMQIFGRETRYPSDEIEWEAQTGNRGMTPFSNEDAPAPIVKPAGVSSHGAKCAFYQEKMFFPASMLNNLRQIGSKQKKEAGKRYVSRQTQMLRNRIDRRKEWMLAKMLTGGSFTYKDPQGKTLSVDYGVPTAHMPDVATQWSDDTANIVEDIMDAKLYMENANGAMLDVAFFPNEVLKTIIMNKSIQSLLSKSSFGDGDLFTRPMQVLGSLFDIPNMFTYNEVYQVRGWLTLGVSSGAGAKTIYVDDATDFEAGSTAYLVDVVNGNKEAVVIASGGVNQIAGTITTDAVTLANSYTAKDCYLVQTQKFLPLDRFNMLASRVEGQLVAETMLSPFGNEEAYGVQLDQWEKKDPDGRYIRARGKSLPVLYFEDAVFSYGNIR